jgi:O-methyltransferase domain
MSHTPFDILMEVSMGFTLPRTLHVIAELGIADALEDTPLGAKALAEKTGTHPDALHRALRVLSAHGIFASDCGEYTHSPASRLLRSDHPQSVRSFVRMQGIPALWHVWEDFDHSIRTGRSAAEKSMPGGFWEYFAAHPQHNRLFNDAMTAQTHAHVAGILNAYDFSLFSTIADVGGGNGHLLRSLLAENPKASGVLFDLPHVVEQARSIPSERITFHPGSFFDDQLPVCDAYLMKIVIHDWNDDEASRILKAIRRAAPLHAKLILAEFMVPEDGKPNWSLFVDLLMLGELTGKERTRTEFGDLLVDADFRLDRVIDTGANIYLLEASVV